MPLLPEVLRSVEFLADGPPELAAEFMAVGRCRDLPRGHVFWNAGQIPQGIVIPVSGELAAIRCNPHGRELCYAFFGTGECAGVPCAWDGLPHAAEMRAIRAGEFFVVDRRSFMGFIEAHPEIRPTVLALVGRLLRHSLDERGRLVFLPASARLAQFLIERACVRASDGARILVRETHAEVAIRVGSVREVIARAMARFIDRGLVRHTRHGLFVRDWAGLCAAARFDTGANRRGPSASEAAARTTRFFLPVLADAPAAVADEARVCTENAPDLAPCAARGCPLSVAAREARAADPPPDATPRPASDPRRSRAADASTLSDGAPGEPRGTPPPLSGATGRRRDYAPCRQRKRLLVDRAPRALRSRGVARRRRRAQEFPRDDAEDGASDRRVELYRARVALIETHFGGEGKIPASVSVFDRFATAGS